MIVVYGSIWPVLLNTAAARAALPPLRLDVAHGIGLSRWDRMRKIVLPSLLPEIVVGVRVAAPICLIITLLVDFLVAPAGSATSWFSTSRRSSRPTHSRCSR